MKENVRISFLKHGRVVGLRKGVEGRGGGLA